MIEGALKLNEKCVKEVMTHINYVFTVSEDEVVDYDFMQRITEAGYSRIPVTKSSTSGNGDITGNIITLKWLVLCYLVFVRKYQLCRSGRCSIVRFFYIF